MVKTRVIMGLSKVSRNIFGVLLACAAICIVFSNFLYEQPSNKMLISNKVKAIVIDKPLNSISNSFDEVLSSDNQQTRVSRGGNPDARQTGVAVEKADTKYLQQERLTQENDSETIATDAGEIIAHKNDNKEPPGLSTTDKSTENPRKKRRILWYNPPSYVRLSHTFNPMASCPQLDCEYTKNFTLVQSSDLVIFDAHTLPVSPPQKLSHQKWVFFAQEAPIHIRHRKLNVPEWRTKFDLTATYRLDSDIPTVYGKIRAKTGRDAVNRDSDYYNELYKKKKRAAVWIVSHCSTPSKREDIVRKLKRFFPVDIFGGCGKEICNRYEDEDCLRKVVGEYMFYISFENALCPDYITEKFFRFFSYDVIQIVRADVNFTTIAPEQTYIDYSNFNSVKKLANTLKAVADDRDIYTSFLKRKDRFESIYEIYSYKTKRYLYSHSHYFNEPLCDLCRLPLTSSSHVSKYPDIYQWFYVDQCKTPTDVKY